ncbi:penicillin-binding protein [Paeniglutamicibacter sp. ABSL32-1]|uniref:penicillin-binding transpeptidase domain-containing protein n=1 Tax=Paeniglutamicibacter quisquiliarum TaxID=2849498 RepID=UPI001C2DD4AE|nr:penicillin-binding transpeptidase domain-containing protein [Paeniglutamicibacter quisquiliarum]MBV1780888.1 penicillin-binding protein [Paeniglutamicibacter quisquiliarum]
MSRVIRTFALPAAALLMIGSLGACSAPPSPNATAELLAGSLQGLDLASVPLAGQDAAAAGAELSEALKPLESIPRTVTLASVTEDEGSEGPKTATAVYNTVWDIDSTDTDWTYQTQATLELDEQTKTWAVRYSPALAVPGLEAGQYVAKRSAPAKRGEILGNKAQTLVTDRPVLRIGINKEAIGEEAWEGSATKLAKVLDIDAEPYAKSVAAAGPRAFVQAITLRDDINRTVTDEQLEAIPGVLAQPGSQPLAPSRSFARAILGSVGEATAEIVAESKGSIGAGDQVGLSGLQKAYQDELAGTKGYSINIYDKDRAEVSTLVSREAVDGQDVKTTLDRDLQTLAESLIADSDSDSALVAIRPSDGAILAAAAGPTDNAQNTALLGKYAPGSTFKVVTALAMLRSGDTPATSVECPATMTVDGKAFKNYDGYPSSALGSIPLSEAVAQSCNTVFLEGASKVKAPALADAAASLGLNLSPSTGAASFLGSVPEDSTGTELAANGIGQGVVEASALGMATVAASVKNGATVSPHLVASPKPDAAPKPKNPLTAAEAKALSGMMAQVVDHGTLKDLKNVPGPVIIGKSGTAEYDAERNAHAWTIAAQGDLAVAVFVGDGSGGAQTAGPILAEFLTEAQ